MLVVVVMMVVVVVTSSESSRSVSAFILWASCSHHEFHIVWKQTCRSSLNVGVMNDYNEKGARKPRHNHNEQKEDENSDNSDDQIELDKIRH